MKVPMSGSEIDESDIAAVVETLRSNRLALGPRTEAFEQAIASYTGARHVIAVSSGTAALHLIVRAMGLGAGDEVLVPSFTFAASVNALLYEGVTPVFVDIEDETFNLDVADAERRITPRTKAIMAVDVFGHPVDWDALDDLAARRGLPIIDDSCEALGAEHRGRKLGTFGAASAFAFYPNKQITTGEGGVITTQDDRIAAMCRSLRNQGRGEMGAWLDHERLGFNYRLDEMSAALGASQMRRIDTFLEKRQRVSDMYNARLKEYAWLRTPIVKPYVRMSWFVYVVCLAEGVPRDEVISQMERSGVPARGYFSPMHTQPYLKAFAPLTGLPVTERSAKRTLALPFHNNVTAAQVEIVTQALSEAVTSIGNEKSGGRPASSWKP